MPLHDYNPWLVAVSVLIAVVDSYVSFSVIGRVARTRGGVRLLWLVMGAMAMGLGVWAMHFIAMMAVRAPAPLGFAVRPTLLALLPMMVAAAVVLLLVSRQRVGLVRRVVGGLVLGCGIVVTHMLGMDALHMEPPPVWRGGLGTLAVIVALAGSMLAMWLGSRVARERRRARRVRRRVLASLAMGSTIAVSHYIGVAALQLVPGARCLSAGDGFSGGAFGVLLTAVSLAVLLITLGVAVLHQRIEYHAGQMQQELEQARAALHAQAYHDSLTGLPNRAMMMDTLRRVLPSAADEPIALMFIDLDGFKTINDSLGHEAGDTFLRAVADALRSSVRARDTVARFGGDEFVIALERFRGVDNLVRVCHKILDLVSRPVLVHGHPVLVSPSIGVAVAPRDGADAATLLRNADAAMYAVKETGKADFRFYEAGMHEQARERLTLTLELRNAIKSGNVCVEYQPKWDLRSGRMCGVEALARWHHPERGEIPPTTFVPLAERSGMVAALGELVLATVLRQLVQWDREGVDVGYVAVNLSLHELRRPSFARFVFDRVAASGIDPSRIRFEITESMAMHHPERSLEQLRELHQRGFSLLADDFGMGYSSFNYLRHLPVGAIKIDRSFVSGMGDVANREITEALIELGKRLNLQTVAEGVETAEQAEWLRGLGCDIAQGFYFARPLKAEQVAGRLPAAVSRY